MLTYYTHIETPNLSTIVNRHDLRCASPREQMLWCTLWTILSCTLWAVFSCTLRTILCFIPWTMSCGKLWTMLHYSLWTMLYCTLWAMSCCTLWTMLQCMLKTVEKVALHMVKNFGLHIINMVILILWTILYYTMWTMLYSPILCPLSHVPCETSPFAQMEMCTLHHCLTHRKVQSLQQNVLLLMPMAQLKTTNTEFVKNLVKNKVI